MHVKSRRLQSFFVVGVKVKTSNRRESSTDTALIPGLWQQYFSENVENQIPHNTGEASIYGVYSNYQGDDDKSYQLIVGREVSSLQDIPRELVGIEIPASDYLVFSGTGQMPELIFTLWESIRQYFADHSEYRRKYSYDFECYDSANTSRLDIYVAIESL